MPVPDLSAYAGKKIAVGLSGGVDSSLAAALLVEAGAAVSGVTMRIWKEGALPAANAVAPGNGVAAACYGPGEEEEVAACAELCAKLGIPYSTVDLSDEYERLVLDYVRAEYRAGRTPNPCVRCNRDLKFGFLMERAARAVGGLEYFATGHYARVEARNGIPHLRMAADLSRDQTYFMHRLRPDLLGRLVFPLGALTKPEARAMAAERGLASADKPDSQDFIAGGYATLFNEETPGDIVDAFGRVIGRHRGLAHYTIGQRRGIGVSAGPEPMYVAELDAVNNRVVISSDQSLLSPGLVGREAFTVDPTLARSPFRALVRIRQNHKPAPALVSVENGRADVAFDQPQRAIAPGQSAVFYGEDSFVLGACVIQGALPR